MCIIITKQKGFDLPAKTTLQTAFRNNPHGAGFMYNDAQNNAVHIRKGFMSFEAFYKALTSEIKAPKQHAIVMHFRISTQGGTQPALTHPYPLTKDIEVMRKLSVKCSIGIAHNGIIGATSDGAKNYNDTMRYIAEYLTLLIHDKNYYKNDAILDFIERTIDYSRLAILDNCGHIEHIGHGWIFDKASGLAYSNTTYKAYEYKTCKPYTAYSGYFDDDDDYYYKAQTPAKSYALDDDCDAVAFVQDCGTEERTSGPVNIYGLYDADGDILDYFETEEKIQNADEVLKQYNDDCKWPLKAVKYGIQWI